MFQSLKVRQDVTLPTGLAFNGRESICEVIFKNGRRLFFDSSISETSLHKLKKMLGLIDFDNLNIFISTQPVPMFKSFDGLAVLAQEAIGRCPNEGDLVYLLQQTPYKY